MKPTTLRREQDRSLRSSLISNLRYRVVGIGERYHWLDRATNQPVPYKSGDAAQLNSLDEAITAFIEGRLTVERNEVLTP